MLPRQFNMKNTIIKTKPRKFGAGSYNEKLDTTCIIHRWVYKIHSK